MNRTVLLLLAIVLPRLPLLWNPLLHVDEATFAVGTHVWLSGGVPYIDFVETKALGVYLFYALGAVFGGSFPHVNMLVVHALTILWAAGIALVVWRIGQRLVSDQIGWIAALFFACASANFIPEFVCPNIEIILLLPWTLTVALLARPNTELRAWHLGGAGVCTAAAMLCKYQAGILIPVVGVYLAVNAWHTARPDRWRRLAQHGVWFGLGLLPLPVLMLLYLAQRDALDAFLLWNFQGSLNYIAGGNALIDVGGKIVKKFFPYLAASGILWYLVSARAAQRLRRHQPPTSTHSAELLVWLWLGAALIAVAVGKRFYDHYFILLTPPLALLAATALPGWLHTAAPARRTILVVFLSIVTVGFTVARFAVHPVIQRLHIEDMATYEPYGRFLRAQTGPQDRLLVWGYSPAIYWYADRLPATRFMWSDLLVGRVPGAPNTAEAIRRAPEFVNPLAWDLFLQDLARHPPAMIIDIAPTGLHHYEGYPMTNYPRLMAFVQAHYEPQPAFQGAPVWKHR